MDPKKMWTIFLVVVGVFTAVLATQALLGYQAYDALTTKTVTTDIQWSTESSWRGMLYPKASFRYAVAGKEFSGTTAFYDHPFRNPAATDDVLTRMGNTPRAVFYDAKRPQNATLVPRFPWKSMLSAALALIIFFYFVLIGGRVQVR